MTKIGIAALAAASLAGCMLGPDYVRPVAPESATFKEAAGWKVAQPRDDAPRGPWWQAFADPDLDRLVAQVEVDNQTVQAAAARLREAQAATQASRAQLWPAVTGNAAAVRSSRATTGTSTDINNSYNAALGLGWELDVWGKIRRGVEASDASAQASAADFAAATLSLQALLAQDYLLLRVQDAEIDLLRNTVAGYERSLQLTQNQYKDGYLTVELLDESSQPLSHSKQVHGDSTRTEITWDQGPPTPNTNRPVALRITLRNAKLFSYWFE